MALAPIGPTLDTTYMVLIRQDPADEAGWHFTDSAEYTDTESVEDWLSKAYGGVFADPDLHRIVEITRTVLAPE